ncbi:S1C family serine protease [Neolewinella antarctica]|uniref:S1-C subfamily serine protease n=1 Tax=Neolewinella antarctica TaxID=442734 RepID=A0ABX0XEM7_9BACT|nr:serine protease [Neolewinella antarctica]NJC27775.1 S1-C subfamily serine protease [Neolewinella antarctica]
MRLIILLLFSLALNSCASIFGSRYQKVEIKSGKGDKVLVNGEPAEKKKGKYLILRSHVPTQITVQRESFQDENEVVMLYKRNALGHTSDPWIIVMGTNVDRGAKAYNYPSKVTIGKRVKLFENGSNTTKNLRVNTTSVELAADDIRSVYFRSYRQFLRREDDKKSKVVDDAEDIKLDNTIFSDALNEILVERGFIDTSGRAITANYLNDMYVDATIKTITTNVVQNSDKGGGMIFVNMEIKWDLLDYYRKSVAEFTTNTTSGQFVVKDGNKGFLLATKDATERGLLTLMGKQEVQKLITIDEDAKDESLADLTLAPATQYVSNVSEALASSVTIKHRKGHGSGFVVGQDGYIITNYHVISELDDSKVIMSDGTEYPFEVIRASKVYDLALLKVEASGLQPFRVSADKDIPIATDIYVIGTPTASDLSQTISRGIISGVRNSGNGGKLIQTDASVNSGNSGGAIITKDGALLGVVSAKLKGYGIEGVGFGIPAYEITDQLHVKQ